MSAPFGSSLDTVPIVQGTAVTAIATPVYYSQEPDKSVEVTKHNHGTLAKLTPMLAGFELWIPPRPPHFSNGMPMYEILGSDAQIVQFPLLPGRQVMCFSGAMAYMSDGMTMKAELSGIMGTLGRLGGGGSLFKLTYTNNSPQNGYIAMTPDYPGVIVPILMADCPSGSIIAIRDSFLCATVGIDAQMTDVSAGFNPANSIGGFLCSGFDFITQTISNGEWAFLMAMGTVIKRHLEPGEKLLVDTNSVLCFEASVGLDIQWVGNLATICCGGEGLFNTTLTGPGNVWIQSMSIDKLRALFPPQKASNGTDGGGGGGGGGE